jgi:predicted DNA binding protein
MVEVLVRYSNLFDQGERVQTLLEIVPEAVSEVKTRTPRQVQHRLTKTQVAELVTAYEAGIGVLDLAQLFGIHRDTVSKILTRAMVEKRKPEPLGGRLDEFLDLYANGMSVYAISKKFGVAQSTIWSAFNKHTQQ